MEKIILKETWFELSYYTDDNEIKDFEILTEDLSSFVTIKDKRGFYVMWIEMSDLDFCMWKFYIVSKSFYDSLLDPDKNKLKIVKKEKNVYLVKDLETSIESLL